MHPRFAEFFRFCLVGGTAFVVDTSLFELFVAAGCPVKLARLPSIAIAMQVSYLLNSHFTFRHHAGVSMASWLRFIASNSVAALLNYSVFFLLLHFVLDADNLLARQTALVSGTAVGLVFNYWANRRFTFAARRP